MMSVAAASSKESPLYDEIYVTIRVCVRLPLR